MQYYGWLTTLKSYPAVLTPPRRGSDPAGAVGVLVTLETVELGVAVPGKH